MKIRITKKGLPKAQVGKEEQGTNSVVVNGIRYLQGDPGYEEAKQEVDRMRSQMGNLRDVNNTIQNLNSVDLKSVVPKIRTEVGNVVNNSIRETRDFLPKVRPAVSNAFQGVRDFAVNNFPRINLRRGTQSLEQPVAENPAQRTTSLPNTMQPWAFLNPMGVQNYFGDMLSGKTNFTTDTKNVADERLRQRNPTLGPTPREQEIEKMGMATPLSNLTADPRSFDIGKAARTVSGITDGLLIAGAAADYFSQDAKLRESDRTNRRNNFDDQALSPMFRGNYNINTGRFRDNVTRKPNEGMFQMGGEQEFANINNMIKIRITGKPENLEFAYGGQSGFGLDLGQRRVQVEMPQSKSESVNRTIKQVPRNQANIEAELGETVYGDLDGDGGLEHMNIGGERHYNGGTPLNVPEGSFIFSDTKKMKIKDPSILSMFGKTYKAGGYTPAQIAKQYDINKYKAIIEDPTSDSRKKFTAEMMVNNYNKKLSALAAVQEGMKGFPQGMPQVARGPQNQMAVAAYGGSLPKYQIAGTVLSPEVLQEIQRQTAEMQRSQQASVPTRSANAQVVDQTFSPKELANLDDPEYANYQALLNKYDTKISRGAINISSMSPEDAKEFARLSGKFGFRRKDAQGKDIFRVIQSSTPGLTFTDSRGKKAGFFGGYSPEMYERRLVEDLLGADAVNNMSELDIRKAYFKELGIDTSNLSDEELSDKKSLYNNKNFFEQQFYPKFAEKFVGSDYRTQMGDDKMIGAEHFDSYREKVKETPGPGAIIGYKCTGQVDDSGVPVVVESSYKDEAARSAAGAYGSAQEAKVNCSGGNTAGKLDTTGTTPDDPTGFFTPDKLALLNAGLMPPQVSVPSVADLPYRQGDLALEDWLAKAQNRQQGFNIAANTLGQYQAGPALASNLSFLAGQTGEGVAQDIAQVDSRNVDRVNQFTAQELQRRAMNDMYNTSARDRRFEGTAIAKQNLANARRKYMTGITQAANNAFANRMYADMVNKVNPIYNLDPRTGLSFFKQGYDQDRLGSGSFNSGAGNVDFGSLGRAYSEAKSKFPELTVGDFMRTATGRTTMSDTNADGIANNVRTNMPGVAMNLPASYNQAFRFMYGGQIGPWTKKKK